MDANYRHEKISLVLHQSESRISNMIEHKSCVVDGAPVMRFDSDNLQLTDWCLSR